MNVWLTIARWETTLDHFLDTAFLMKTENGDKNVFDWIFENIFSENENRKQPENENNKISFSVFSIENSNLILSKI